jgi:predicted transcriptional regulator
MKPVCEVIVNEVLPSVRALVAERLTKSYGLSQEQAAARLGTTQPAISHYKRAIRGYRTRIFKKDPRLDAMLNSLAEKAASGEIPPNRMAMEFCAVCMYMRRSGLICEIHKGMNPLLEDCRMCMEGSC